MFDVVLVDGNIGCADSLSAQANCRIMYDGTEQTVTIDENQRIEVGYETGLDNEMEDVVFDLLLRAEELSTGVFSVRTTGDSEAGGWRQA